MRQITGGGTAEALSRDGRYVLVSVYDIRSDTRSRVEIVGYDGRNRRVIVRGGGEASWNL